MSRPTLAAATDRYWDANGTTDGAGGPNAFGTWSATTEVWNTDSTGGAGGAIGSWTAGDNAIFSAGTDATGNFLVFLSGTQTVNSITVDEGTITFNGSTANINNGAVNVNNGATLVTDSSARIAATAGAVFTLNGGTLRTTNTGSAGSFIDADATITLGALGGTIDYQVTNKLNIIQTATVISGSGALTKTGAGVLAIASPSTYTGATNITDGELRIRGGSNRLPTATALTVSGNGILNLNDQDQQIGSLSGDGTVGLGNRTLTIGGGTSTTFSGVIKDIANAGAGAVSTGAGKLTKSGSGTLTLTNANTYTGGTTITNGRINTRTTNALSTGTITISPTGNVVIAADGSAAASVTLPNKFVLNSSARTIDIAANSGKTLSLTGQITGDADWKKDNSGATGNLVLANSTNNFTGVFTIVGGTATATANNALGATSGKTVVSNNASLAFDGGVNYAAAEPVDITGNGRSSAGAINSPSGSNTFAGPITLKADSAVGAASGASLALSGAIGGSFALSKVGDGIVTLTNDANGYTGNTTVSAGTLALSHATSTNLIASSPVINVASGATLDVTGMANGFTLASGQTLKGKGAFVGSVDIGAGTLAPGSSPGTISFTNLTLGPSSTYAYEINGTDPTAGNNINDLSVGSGSLTINGATADITVNPNFDPALIGHFTYRMFEYGTTYSGTGFGTVNFTPPANDYLYKIVDVPSATGGAINLDIQHKAVLTASATANDTTVIIGGSTPVKLTVGNTAVADSADADFTTSTTANMTGAASGTVVAVGSGDFNGISFTATTLGSETGTITVSDPNAANSSQQASVTVNVIDHASPDVTGANVGKVIKGTSTSGSGSLANAAGNRAALEVLGVPAGLTGLVAGDKLAAGDPARSISGAADTANAGNTTATYNINVSDDTSIAGATSLPDAQFSIQAIVLEHSDATFANTSGAGTFTLSFDGDHLTIDFGSLTQGATTATSVFDVFNAIVTQDFTAGLDLDNITGTGDTSTFSLFGPNSFAALAAGNGQQFSIDFSTLNTGTFHAQYTFYTSDEDGILGGYAVGSQSIVLDINGVINPRDGGGTPPGSAVPVPTSVYTGLSLLAGLGVARRLRRSRVNGSNV